MLETYFIKVDWSIHFAWIKKPFSGVIFLLALLLATCYLIIDTYYLLLAACFSYLQVAACYVLFATCYFLLAFNHLYQTGALELSLICYFSWILIGWWVSWWECRNIMISQPNLSEVGVGLRLAMFNVHARIYLSYFKDPDYCKYYLMYK